MTSNYYTKMPENKCLKNAIFKLHCGLRRENKLLLTNVIREFSLHYSLPGEKLLNEILKSSTIKIVQINGADYIVRNNYMFLDNFI